MKHPLTEMRKTLTLLVCILVTFLFCATNLDAQNFIGKDLLVCNLTDDFTSFKFENDTVFIQFGAEDDYFPFSLYSIKGDTIIWNDINELEGCESELTGEYIFVESGDSLTLDPIYDECEERLEVLELILFKINTISNIPRIDSPEFIFYPNPVINSFEIETSDQNNYNFQLISSNGQVVLESEIVDSKRYNIDWLAKGTYYINIKNEDKQLVKTAQLVKM